RLRARDGAARRPRLRAGDRLAPAAPSSRTLMSDYEPVIGMEMHAELLTRSKMFCGCDTRFGAPPNTQCCPVCLGLPGSLPVPNRAAVEHVIRTALAPHCRINEQSIFHRKNYLYPDLPKAYQTSQHDIPLGV